MSLPKSYNSADASKIKYLMFKGVSNNISVNEFKELLDFGKITYAEAERMKSKRSRKELPFIKIKCDDPKQAEALISGELVCQKTGIIFRVEEFKTTPSILQCFKCQGFRHKAPNCTKSEKCVVCGEAKRERPRDHLLSHLLSNPSCRPQTIKTGLHLLPQELTQNLIQ